MRFTPSTELECRIRALQACLVREGIDAALIVDNADLYYFAGTTQQSHLLVPAEGEPLLLVRRDEARARRESGLPSIEGLASLRTLPGALSRIGISATAVVGLELDVLPVNNFHRYQGLLPEARLVDCSGVMREVRSVKSDYEIATMREAAVVADLVAREAAVVLREGMTELDLSARLEAVQRAAGHQGLVRFRSFGHELLSVHVFAGPEAALPSAMDTPLGGRGLTPAVPQGAGRRPIGRGEPVVLDVVGTVDGYLVDQTRVFSVGTLDPDYHAAYAACLEIQGMIASLARPGMACEELYTRAVDTAEQAGFSDWFMGLADSRVHFIGHGVGLEADELPVIGRGSRSRLVAGNVVAVEPKMVFPGRGVVGIENTWVVRDGGLQRLTFADEAIIEV